MPVLSLLPAKKSITIKSIKVPLKTTAPEIISHRLVIDLPPLSRNKIEILKGFLIVIVIMVIVIMVIVVEDDYKIV